jgi:hypothetical protein
MLSSSSPPSYRGLDDGKTNGNEDEAPISGGNVPERVAPYVTLYDRSNSLKSNPGLFYSTPRNLLAFSSSRSVSTTCAAQS